MSIAVECQGYDFIILEETLSALCPRIFGWKSRERFIKGWAWVLARVTGRLKRAEQYWCEVLYVERDKDGALWKFKRLLLLPWVPPSSSREERQWSDLPVKTCLPYLRVCMSFMTIIYGRVDKNGLWVELARLNQPIQSREWVIFWFNRVTITRSLKRGN